MIVPFVKTLLRRHLRHPRLYAYARRAMLVAQYLMRRPDEPDLRAFGALADVKEGLIVDIGANGGQSAVAFAFLLPKFRILSFEPNPALWPELDFIARIFKRRFSYRKVGLGSESGEMILHIPQVGGFPVTTRASLARGAAAAHCQSLQEEIGEEFGLAETRVSIVKFDELELAPDIVKIDVEGFEIEVLRGMEKTLALHRPVLMVEENAEEAACMALLSRHRYRIARWDQSKRAFADNPARRTRNWFALPEEKAGLFGL